MLRKLQGESKDSPGISTRQIYDWGDKIDPSLPTQFPPGSPEKIRVMQIRVELGLPLHHPEDAKNEPIQIGDYGPKRIRVAGMEKAGGWWF